MTAWNYDMSAAPRGHEPLLLLTFSHRGYRYPDENGHLVWGSTISYCHWSERRGAFLSWEGPYEDGVEVDAVAWHPLPEPPDLPADLPKTPEDLFRTKP